MNKLMKGKKGLKGGVKGTKFEPKHQGPNTSQKVASGHKNAKKIKQ